MWYVYYQFKYFYNYTVHSIYINNANIYKHDYNGTWFIHTHTCESEDTVVWSKQFVDSLPQHVHVQPTLLQ